MKNLTWTVVLGAGLAFGISGCDEDPNPAASGNEDMIVVDMSVDTGGSGGVGGTGGTGGIPIMPDMAGMGGMPADMAVDAAGGMGGMPPVDLGVDAEPDMNVIDMAAADMQAPEVDAGLECVDNEPCSDVQRCIDGACRMDLRPTVFRMTAATVTEPAAAAQELQLALAVAVNNGNLNLMFEAGGYNDDGYRFHVGNGRPNAGVYAFRHNLPIQNFDGTWRTEEDRSEWHIEGRQRFLIVVPAGTNVDEEGMESTCWIEVVTNVNMQLWPAEDEQGNPTLKGFVEGTIREDAIENIELRVGGNVIRFIDFFDGSEPSIDTDDDGVNDAYPFLLAMDASPVDFADADESREPNPPPLPVCE